MEMVAAPTQPLARPKKKPSTWLSTPAQIRAGVVFFLPRLENVSLERQKQSGRVYWIHMYKRILSAAFLVLSMIVSPLMSLSAQALSPLPPYTNSLIRIDGNQTVYWRATDGKRYVFPNARTFYSWFAPEELSRVITISPSEMGNIMIGGNVTYRPGVRLVKVTTDPRVYAVGRYGTLRWVTSEALAQQLYGQNWAQQVDDVPDEFFINYRIGDPIYTASQYNVQFELGQARSPSDNISTNSQWPNPPQNPPLSGFVNFSINNTVANLGDTIVLSGNALNVGELAQNMTISLINRTTGQTLRSCVGILPCTYNLYVDQSVLNAGSSQNFYARVTSINGGALNSSDSNVQFRGTNANLPGTSMEVTFSRTEARVGENFNVTASIFPQSTGAPYYTIRIYDQWNVLQHTCINVRTCVLQQVLPYTTDANRSYYATATADNGQRLTSPTRTIVIQPSGSQNARLGNSQLSLGLSSNSAITVTPNLTVANGTEVRVSASIQPALSNPTGVSIKFYDGQGTLLFTCSNYNECSTTKVVGNGASQDAQIGFKARVEDSYGAWYESPLSYVTVRPAQTADYSNSVYNRTFELSPSNTTVRHGDTLTLTARVTPQTGSASGFAITITNPLGTVLKTCNNAFTCTVDQPIYNTGSQDASIVYSARVTSLDGHWNSANTPTITILGTPASTITGSIGLGISHATIASNQPFNLNARVLNSNVSDSNLKIAWYQSSNDALITTCSGINPCLISTSYPAIGGQSREIFFYAKAWDMMSGQSGELRSDQISIKITP